MSDFIIPMHTLKCDRCGVLARDDEMMAMEDYSMAVDRWMDDDFGWARIATADGIGDYCPNCYVEDEDGNVTVRKDENEVVRRESCGQSELGEAGKNDSGDRGGARSFREYDWQDHQWQW